MLGDVYLRHGWYAAAYRQYTTLTRTSPPAEPRGWLRLPRRPRAAGASTRRSLQRKVSPREGTPGPERSARVGAAPVGGAHRPAARRGRRGAAAGAEAESLARKLKELQLFSGPRRCVVAWEDYAAELALAARDGQVDAALGDGTFAPAVGLTAVQLPASGLRAPGGSVRAARVRRGGRCGFVVTTIAWD